MQPSAYISPLTWIGADVIAGPDCLVHKLTAARNHTSWAATLRWDCVILSSELMAEGVVLRVVRTQIVEPRRTPGDLAPAQREELNR
jgi:hypothetical protein